MYSLSGAGLYQPGKFRRLDYLGYPGWPSLFGVDVMVMAFHLHALLYQLRSTEQINEEDKLGHSFFIRVANITGPTALS